MTRDQDNGGTRPVRCIGSRCVSRWREYECSKICAGRCVLAGMAKGESFLSQNGNYPQTGNRYGEMLFLLGFAEGQWPTRITDAGRAALTLASAPPEPVE